MHALSTKEGIKVYHPTAVCHSSEDETDVCMTDDATSHAFISPLRLSTARYFGNPVTSAFYTKILIQNSIKEHSFKMPWPLTSLDVNLNSFEESSRFWKIAFRI